MDRKDTLSHWLEVSVETLGANSAETDPTFVISSLRTFSVDYLFKKKIKPAALRLLGRPFGFR